MPRGKIEVSGLALTIPLAADAQNRLALDQDAGRTARRCSTFIEGAKQNNMSTFAMFEHLRGFKPSA